MFEVTEQTLIEIYQKILNVSNVNSSTDFFESGGDSLLATRVLSAVMREYKVELTIVDLYEAPTPTGLKATIIKGFS